MINDCYIHIDNKNHGVASQLYKDIQRKYKKLSQKHREEVYQDCARLQKKLSISGKKK